MGNRKLAGSLSLAGEVALVTGASRGIGRAIAIELAQRGADVAVNYLQARDDADSVIREIEALERNCIGLPANVADAHAVDQMFTAAESTLGPVSILVNAAGLESDGSVEQLSEEDWSRVIDVNLTGPFLCMRRAIPKMSTGGSIVNISSIHSTIPRKGAAHYCASKAGLEMVSKTAALEVASRGIRVNCVAPGAILTDMNRDLIQHEIGLEKWREWIPIGRVGSTREVAQLVAFLASADASYITGETITIDGAYNLNLVRYG